MISRLSGAAAGAILVVAAAAAQAPSNGLNPQVKEVVDSISEDRIGATLTKLQSFGTRYVMSAQDDPAHGIGAAKRWIHDQFASYSPRLQVSYQTFHIKKGARRGQVLHEVELANVIAVLPGTVDKDRFVIVSGHYDTVNLHYKPPFNDQERMADLIKRGMVESEAKRYIQLFPTDEARPEVDNEATAAETISPGVTDDGSGTATVLELARVMSKYQFHKSLVFIAFAGEEIGLEGSKVYAESAEAQNMQIEAVLNNDIVGSIMAGDGRTSNSSLRVFAGGPEDSPARALLRYTKLIAERYVPSMRVDMIFHQDRFNRGGDQLSFFTKGYAAVRLTTPAENYQNQHTATDTLDNTSPPYVARVAKMNCAVAASIALAPAPPVVNYTILSGERKGDRLPMLSRGKSEYDAVMRWQPAAAASSNGDVSNLAGYAIVMRSTTAPDWQREIWVGNTTTYVLKDFSIDDVVLGVKAVDRDGNQSLVSAYLEPVRQELVAPPARPTK